jgi:hypothetical protein
MGGSAYRSGGPRSFKGGMANNNAAGAGNNNMIENGVRQGSASNIGGDQEPN